MSILQRAQKEFCPACEIGAAGATVGYLSFGSSLDYAYDKLGVAKYERVCSDRVFVRLRDLPPHGEELLGGAEEAQEPEEKEPPVLPREERPG